jgi:predicted peptidase
MIYPKPITVIMVLKSKHFRIVQAIGLALVIHFQAFSQVELIPIDNPYQVVEQKASHWTNTIKWSNVVNALEVPKMVDYTSVKNQVDSTILISTLQSLEKQGGGVLYFPSGTYFFGYNFPMFNGVVIRGAMPIERQDSAGNKTKILITNFEFPKYTTSGLGKGTPNSKAFKMIFTTKATQNFGLVNIDINRGMIDFAGLTTANGQVPNQNIMLWGIRQNNVSYPNPLIPTAFQRSHERSWQRWGWKIAANINVKAAKNCLIAHCQLNENTTDNYSQNHFMLNDGMVVDGTKAYFDFTDHLGISINNTETNLNEISSSKSSSELVFTEQSQKCVGLEIFQNTIRLTEGNNAIVVSAKKPVIRNNQINFTANSNLVKDGISISDKRYALLTDGTVPSEARLYINKSNNDTLPYRLVKPLNYNPQKKYPVVMFFHHGSESGKDNISQLRQFVWQFVSNGNQEKYPCFIVAPQKPIIPDSTGESGWVDERPSLSSWGVPWRLVAAVKAVNMLKKEYSFDSERIYVVGIGQGGDAVWDLLVRFPSFFAAGVPISSWYEFTLERTSKIEEMPIWMFNGGSVVDSPLDPHSTELPLSRMMQLNIFKDTKKVKHTEFPRRGTFCWDEIESVKDFMPWLFDQKKSSPLTLSSK